MSVPGKSPLRYPPNTQPSLNRVAKPRAPTANDYKNFSLGDEWLNTASDDWYKLANINGNIATWILIGGTGPEEKWPITPYVVGPAGQADYQTIQMAIDAANGDGGGTVWVQPGTYTENLTLYDQVEVVGAGGVSDLGATTIVGVHTPPTSGFTSFRNLYLQSATHIWNSAAAGSAKIRINHCAIDVTNGYTFNLPNWTGELGAFDLAEFSTDNGFVNNTGGAPLFFTTLSGGVGNANAFICTGSLTLYTCDIACPVSLQTGTVAKIDAGCVFRNTITLANDSTGYIANTSHITGANAAITMSSSADWDLYDLSIDCSAGDAIDGSGAGTITLGTITFVDTVTIAATLTLSRAYTRSGVFETLPLTARLAMIDTSIQAGGSDANVDISITPKGTGGVVVDTNLTVGDTSQNVDFTINGSAISSIITSEAEGATDVGEYVSHRHSDTAGLGTNAIYMRSRGTGASEQAVQASDVLGRLLYAGYDGTDYAQAAEIRVEVDGTPGANDMPGRIVFLTSLDSGQTPAEVMRLDSEQKVSLINPLAETSGGTNQGSYTTGDILYASASNTLSKLAIGTDNYLMQVASGVPSWNLQYEGLTTFTPSIEGSSAAGTASYSEQTGRYIRLGNMIWFTVNLTWTGHTGTGDMLVTDFPYIFAAALSFYPNTCVLQNITLPASTIWITFDGINNSTSGEIIASKDGAAFSKVQMSAAGSVYASGWYPTD